MRRSISWLLLLGAIVGFTIRELRLTASSAAEPGASRKSDAGLIARVEALEKAAVSRGMLIPYFGKDLPDGYIWADGTKNWPDEDWVPQQLWGQPVPDMRQQLIGGSPSEKEVGLVWAKGHTKNRQIQIYRDMVKVKPNPAFPRQNLMAAVSRDQGGKDETFGEPRINLTFARIAVAAYGDANGNVEIPALPLDSAETNPRHVMCRWIIRVK